LHIRFVSLARIVGLLFSLLTFATPTLAVDGPWPTRTVHVIVAQAVGGPPERLARLTRDDQERWAQVVREAGIKPD